MASWDLTLSRIPGNRINIYIKYTDKMIITYLCKGGVIMREIFFLAVHNNTTTSDDINDGNQNVMQECISTQNSHYYMEKT